MDNKTYILLEADDCCLFENQQGHSEAIRFFISKASTFNFFHFTTSPKEEELPEIAWFNYREAKWYAGRFVGEATFDYDGRSYKLKVNPRFGILQLFRMLEEVFNIRFTNSNNLLSPNKNLQQLIKKLISFLWLNMLSRANKHGLPRQTVSRLHKGSIMKGRLNVSKSINPLYTEQQIISSYKEKSIDETIAGILGQSYKILISEYDLAFLSFPINAVDALKQIKAGSFRDISISENMYKKISYKDIYLSYKPVVDLSWDIIKKKSIDSHSINENTKSFSFFIDMAEIWELYLRTILDRNFSRQGWVLRKDELVAYKDKIFRRKLIPDIVFQKDDMVMVWDAKYKRMHYDYFDYDRADFFQIHTYINYYHQNFKVVAGGLLYPLSQKFDDTKQRENKSDTLFSTGFTPTKFIIDGIDFSGINKDDSSIELFKNEEQKFLQRITSLT